MATHSSILAWEIPPFRVVTGTSWSPLSALKGVKPPVELLEPPPVAGASELPTLRWFWPEGLSSGLTGTWRPFPGSFPCFTPPSHLEIKYGSLGLPFLPHSALRRCLATERPGA